MQNDCARHRVDAVRIRNARTRLAILLVISGFLLASHAAAQNRLADHPTATLTSITVTPTSVTTTPGASGQFTATGFYSDGSKKNLDSSATWASSATSVATVSSTGLLTTVAQGTATISATVGLIGGSANVTVTPVVLKSISVTPSPASVPAGYNQQFTATGTYSDGSTKNLTSTATWTSSETSVAVVSSTGFVLTATQGATTVSARFGSISGSSALTVNAPLLTSLSVTPTGVSIAAGNSQQFTATGIYSNGTTQNLTSSAIWISSSPQVANISATGLATSVAKGTTGITAISGTITGAAALNVATGPGPVSNFQHIIVVVQENRTPDNLFQGLCSSPYGSSSSCSTTPTSSQYDIQTSNWLDNTSSTGFTQPSSVPLAGGYDLGHDHLAFIAMCDVNASGVCLMDGAAQITCGPGTCVPKPQFKYVDNSTGILNPDLSIATQYGWANYMFQTNQGASYPAHLYLFAGTSAPSADDDASGIFAAGNMNQVGAGVGCTTLAGTSVPLIGPLGQNAKIYPSVYPCFEHPVLSDLLDASGLSWKYYAATGPESIWTAPTSIQHICVPNQPTGGECTGSDWLHDLVINSAQVLTDIGNCNLANVSWVTPTALNSDHPVSNTGGGPSWIASIVNAIGNQAACPDGETYWNNTAIFVTWDDWGGWYDHEPPTLLNGPQGDYQYGFRVPFLVISAYTPAGYVDNNRMDFGSVLRFIEYNFGFDEGSLNFADARSQVDLTEFFDLNQAPRVFQPIPAPLDADYFINDKTPPEEPDEY